MKGAIIAMVLAALTPSRSARADGSPAWTGRARAIVARIQLPRSGDISKENGIGFFVGFKGQTAYLVTAGHVIWPRGLPENENGQPRSENVKLELMLPDCDVPVPAVASSEQAKVPTIADPAQTAVLAGADSAQANPPEEFDVARVQIDLTTISNDVRVRCKEVLEHLKDLPRHILDPDEDKLSENTRAWLIGPGTVHEGRVPRPITFEKYEGNHLLQFIEPFTPGDSGSPIFSDRGHLIGMAIKTSKDRAFAIRFSVILTQLDKDWETPVNLAGSYSRLSFGDQYKGARLSIDGAPDVELRLPQHPAPLGQVALTLRISSTQEVTDTVNIWGAEMNCEVAISKLLARHKRVEVYTTLGLVVATGVAFAVTKTLQSSFDQSPSRTSYDGVRMFNAITIGSGSAALASLGVTMLGYLSTERSAITCKESPP